jgi:molybdenum cofactor synthesis domain-containing protein
MRVAILTVSDSAFKAKGSNDRSGEAIFGWCQRRGDEIVARHVVDDEASKISALLASICDAGSVDLIITTGGTGLAPRDVTPEATRAVIDREAQGIAEYLRAMHFQRMPRAALSRGIAGTRGKTLIVNLPGSLSATQDGLATLLPIIDHAIDILSGRVTRHETPTEAWSTV